MVCKRCAQPNPDNVEYCLYCGEKLSLNKQEIETLNPDPVIENLNNNETKAVETLTNSSIEKGRNEKKSKKGFNKPIFDDEDEVTSEKINIFKLIILTFGVLFRPGTTIVEKTKKYNKIKTGLFVYLVFSSITFLVYISTIALKNCFIQTYNIASEKYTPVLDFGQLQYLDYTKLITEAALVSYGILLLLILLYYIASFLTNKGLSLGRYFVVITLSLSPFLILTCAASPIVSIYNTTFGSWLLVFGIAYSLIILLCTINDIIAFKNTNQKIIYHSLILLICFAIVYVLLSIFAKNLIGF